MLFCCDAPSWVCLLYAQVWYGEVPGPPDMKPRFIFGYVMPVGLIVVLNLIIDFRERKQVVVVTPPIHTWRI